MKRPGVYVLLIRLDRDASIEVGRLGSAQLKAGSYAYVGSAMGGLDGRIARHLRTEKRTHWHIDYLLEHATVTRVLEIETAERLECGLSRALAALDRSSTPVPGFGSSDCGCHAHLYYLGRGANAEAVAAHVVTGAARAASLDG